MDMPGLVGVMSATPLQILIPTMPKLSSKVTIINKLELSLDFCG